MLWRIPSGRNRQMRMTKAEKRIAIAKDVLKQIKLRTYKPKAGTYVEISQEIAKTIPRSADVQLQDMLPKIKDCKVCALGACFMSSVRRFNGYSTGAANLGSVELSGYAEPITSTSHKMGSWETREQLRRFFSDKQLNLSECWFEGWDYDHFGGGAQRQGSPEAVAFRRKHRSPSKRMARNATASGL